MNGTTAKESIDEFPVRRAAPLPAAAAMAHTAGCTAALTAAPVRRSRAAARRPAAASASAHEGRARVAAAGAAASALLAAAGPAAAAVGGNAVAQLADASSVGLTLASGGAIAGLAFLLATTDPSKRCAATAWPCRQRQRAAHTAHAGCPPAAHRAASLASTLHVRCEP
jgi:hypothetical protein